MGNLRQKFNPGTKVILDKGFHNESEVEIISQTSKKLFTKVKNSQGYEWEVMTNRLSPIVKS